MAPQKLTRKQREPACSFSSCERKILENTLKYHTPYKYHTPFEFIHHKS